LVILTALLVAFASSGANAQGALLTKCGQILLNYLGKPFAKSAAAAAGGEVGKYLIDRGLNTLRRGDVQQLQNQGLTECEIRQQVEAIYAAQQPSQQAGYSAIAKCSVTGAIGTAQGFPTPQQALRYAIYDCANRGGIPACCQHGAIIVP
jgi:hypothetical protein